MPILSCDEETRTFLREEIITKKVDDFKFTFPDGYSKIVSKEQLETLLDDYEEGPQEETLQIGFLRRELVVIDRGFSDKTESKKELSSGKEILFVVPILYQGGCFEDRLYKILTKAGYHVTIAVLQDINPKRFFNDLDGANCISLSSGAITPEAVQKVKTYLSSRPNTCVIFSRLWLFSNNELFDQLKDLKNKFIGCERGWFRASELEKFWERYERLSILSLMLEDYKDGLPESLQEKVDLHGLFPKYMKFQEPSLKPKRFKIAYLGRIAADKNTPALVSIVWCLKELFNIEPQLDIIGGGPSLFTLMDQTKKMGLEQSISFKGYIEDPDKMLAEYDISINPSHSEGISNATLESLQAGTGVVAYDHIPGNRHLIEDSVTGKLVPFTGNAMQDAISFAEAIAQFGSVPISDRWEDAISELRKKVSDDVTVENWLQSLESIFQDQKTASSSRHERLKFEEPIVTIADVTISEVSVKANLQDDVKALWSRSTAANYPPLNMEKHAKNVVKISAAGVGPAGIEKAKAKPKPKPPQSSPFKDWGKALGWRVIFLPFVKIAIRLIGGRGPLASFKNDPFGFSQNMKNPTEKRVLCFFLPSLFQNKSPK